MLTLSWRRRGEGERGGGTYYCWYALALLCHGMDLEQPVRKSVAERHTAAHPISTVLPGVVPDTALGVCCRPVTAALRCSCTRLRLAGLEVAMLQTGIDHPRRVVGLSLCSLGTSLPLRSAMISRFQPHRQSRLRTPTEKTSATTNCRQLL